MNCEAKELRQKNFLACIGLLWFRTSDHNVCSLASYPLDHEVCSVSKGTELPDKFSINKRPLSFCGLTSLFSYPHCNSTSTDEITAPHQKYEHNDY
jgi:hypothetical protein